MIFKLFIKLQEYTLYLRLIYYKRKLNIKIHNMIIIKKSFIALICALFLLTEMQAQKVHFLHHSTGRNLWLEGKVAEYIQNYNNKNGTNYLVTEYSYPNTPYPWDNYPYDYWNLWINKTCSNSNLNIECIDQLTSKYNVIIFKHCFPGAQILEDVSNPKVSSDVKALNIYKLQYRALRDMMDSYPANKFIIWTLAPLHRLATNPANAARAKEFTEWVKNQWLTEDGKKHPNIYIFDFFGYAAESNTNPPNGLVNCLKYEYERDHSSSDSHPNKLANETIGPFFAEFIIETLKNQSVETKIPETVKDVNIYPNPVSGELVLNLPDVQTNGESILEIFDLSGRKIYSRQIPNEPTYRMDLNGLSPDIYILKIQTGNNSYTRKLAVK